MPLYPRSQENGNGSSESSESLVLHVRNSPDSRYKPMPLDSPRPIEFEQDNFTGRCVFIHRPSWTYENPETGEIYPYRQLFHGRKRLWEWRLQGRFKRRPGMLYCGIELEDYVPVNFATRSLMRGILPLIQAAIQCKLVHHEVGDPYDPSVRPTVVAPIWSADNTLVHEDPAEAPDLTVPTLPDGLNRKAARQFWEELWAGRGPAWNSPAGNAGPIFTFVIWGPSQLLDLRAWVFRKLPLMWGRQLPMEPFCGKQPVHAVVYELSDGQTAKKHRQGGKVYSADIRMCPPAVWALYAEVTIDLTAMAAPDPEQPSPKDHDDGASFCSAHSQGSSPELDPEQQLLQGGSQGTIQIPALSPTIQLPLPLAHASRHRQLPTCLGCCRRRRSRELPPAMQLDQLV